MIFGESNIVAMTVVTAGWVATMLQWTLHKRTQKSAAGPKPKRDTRSLYGFAVQFVAVFIAYFGPVRASLDLANAVSLTEAGIVTLIVAAALLLNMSALKTLGSDFAVVAQVREQGSLATKGPYALVRNPIYLCYMLLMIAAGLSFGHPLNLLLAIPVYIAGTALRIAPEERLLRERYGAEYDAYAARVKRLIPFIW